MHLKDHKSTKYQMSVECILLQVPLSKTNFCKRSFQYEEFPHGAKAYLRPLAVDFWFLYLSYPVFFTVR